MQEEQKNSEKPEEEFSSSKVKKVKIQKQTETELKPAEETIILPKMTRKEYETEMVPLHVELLKLQNWIKSSGTQLAVVVEGRDAAGKGGFIKSISQHLNPRGCRIVALEKPTQFELSQWYFQKYVRQLPQHGEMVFFDRSWYNRAGVEKVMGFCTPKQTEEFLDVVPDFEHMLVRSSMKLIKLWFSVSKDEQQKRFKERQTNILKHWKLSEVDKLSQDLWDDYTKAKEDMFKLTSTKHAPWTVCNSNDKKRGRVNAIKYILSQIDYYAKDESLLNMDTRIIRKIKM